METVTRTLSQRLIAGYYAASVLFFLGDYLFSLNVRLTFLDQWPGWRVAYYLACFACFLLIRRYPAWSNVVAAGESLLNLSLMIISTAARALIVTDAMLETGRPALGLRDIVNFLLSGSVAYLALAMRAHAARRELGGSDV